MRVQDVFTKNRSAYGVHKMWKALNRQQVLDEHGRPTGKRYPPVARCTVARRMSALGPRGAVAGDHKRPVTTIPGPDHRPEDALERDFSAEAPDSRWVADITYVPTWSGFVYVAFVLDLFSRRIVGWRVSSSLRTDLALDALEQGGAFRDEIVAGIEDPAEIRDKLPDVRRGSSAKCRNSCGSS